MAVLALTLGIGGCAVTDTSVDVVARQAPQGGPIRVWAEPCVDRTGTTERDLGAEATKLLRDRLAASKEFAIAQDAQFRLVCDVTKYLPGSAFKRWLMPGLGPTIGQVSVMVSDARTSATVLILRGNANVSSGGLYSVGAEHHILSAAIDDVMTQLRSWAHGAASPGGKQ